MEANSLSNSRSHASRWTATVFHGLSARHHGTQTRGRGVAAQRGISRGGSAPEQDRQLFLARATEEITWSEQVYSIFELDPGSPVTLGLIGSRVHPEDIPLLYDMVERAKAGKDFEYEHRLLLPENRVKYLHLVGHGRETRMVKLSTSERFKCDRAPAFGRGAGQASVGACARRQGHEPWCLDGIDRARSQPAAFGHCYQRQHMFAHVGCRSTQHRRCA